MSRKSPLLLKNGKIRENVNKKQKKQLEMETRHFGGKTEIRDGEKMAMNLDFYFNKYIIQLR